MYTYKIWDRETYLFNLSPEEIILKYSLHKSGEIYLIYYNDELILIKGFNPDGKVMNREDAGKYAVRTISILEKSLSDFQTASFDSLMPPDEVPLFPNNMMDFWEKYSDLSMDQVHELFELDNEIDKKTEDEIEQKINLIVKEE